MKFKGINKIHQGKYIARYDIQYESEKGREKTYEMISRNKHITTEDDLHNNQVDAVVLIMHDSDKSHILLNREFRMAPAETVINFPAGLIDQGESLQEAAARELREETGLRLDSIEEEWKESYSAVGFSNEKNVVVIGKASGTLQESDSDMEEIEARWYSKEDVKKLLQTERFAARTQAYCALWSAHE